jgi:hypothetical protein
MPIIKNRRIDTNLNTTLDEEVTLEALKDSEFRGKNIVVGEIITLKKDEAKKAIAADKGLFRVKVR